LAELCHEEEAGSFWPAKDGQGPEDDALQHLIVVDEGEIIVRYRLEELTHGADERIGAKSLVASLPCDVSHDFAEIGRISFGMFQRSRGWDRESLAVHGTHWIQLTFHLHHVSTRQ
jgi:hypothetical protein